MLEGVGWGSREEVPTMPVLLTDAQRADLEAAAAAEKRVRRWKRPQYVLGRPDPAYAEKRGP